MSKWLLTIGFLVLSTILTHLLPFSSFFRNLDTMIHEFGHAAATLLLSGEVLYIYLFADHSGVTLSSVEANWRLIPVALAGYTTASIFTVYLFNAYRKGNHKRGLAVVTVLAAVNLLFFVRNGFGVLWLIGFIALTGLIIALAGQTVRNLYYLFIAFLTLEESVFAPISLVFLALSDPVRAGDASTLARATGLPALFWALLFTLFALFCAKQSLQMFFGRRGKKSARQPEYRESL